MTVSHGGVGPARRYRLFWETVFVVIPGGSATSRGMGNRNVIEVNDRNFAETTLTAEVPVLVDFTAVWCAPCRVIAPHVEAMADEYEGKLRVGKCDADTNPELSARYDVRSLPTLLLFKNGQVVGQLVGAVPRARIEALVERALATAAA